MLCVILVARFAHICVDSGYWARGCRRSVGVVLVGQAPVPMGYADVERIPRAGAFRCGLLWCCSMSAKLGT